MLNSIISKIKDGDDRLIHGVVRVRQVRNAGRASTPQVEHGAEKKIDFSSLFPGEEEILMPSLLPRSYEISNETKFQAQPPVSSRFSSSTKSRRVQKTRGKARSSCRSVSYRPHKASSRQKPSLTYRVMTPAYSNSSVALPSRVYTPRYSPNTAAETTPAYGPGTPFYMAGAGSNASSAGRYGPSTPFYIAGMNISTPAYAPKSPHYSAGMSVPTPAYAPKNSYSMNISTPAYDVPKSPYYAAGMNLSTPYHRAGMNAPTPAVDAKSPYYSARGGRERTESPCRVTEKLDFSTGADPQPAPSAATATVSGSGSNRPRVNSSVRQYTVTTPSILGDDSAAWKPPHKASTKRVRFRDEEKVLPRACASDARNRANRVVYNPDQPQYSPTYDPDPYFDDREYNPMFPSVFD